MFMTQERVDELRYKGAFIDTRYFDWFIKEPVEYARHCKHFTPVWSCNGHGKETSRMVKGRRRRNTREMYIIFACTYRGVELLMEAYQLAGQIHGFGPNTLRMEIVALKNQATLTDPDTTTYHDHVKISLSYPATLYKLREASLHFSQTFIKLRELYPEEFY